MQTHSPFDLYILQYNWTYLDRICVQSDDRRKTSIDNLDSLAVLLQS